jgi:hypothetical protein
VRQVQAGCAWLVHHVIGYQVTLGSGSHRAQAHGDAVSQLRFLTKGRLITGVIPGLAQSTQEQQEFCRCPGCFVRRQRGMTPARLVELDRIELRRDTMEDHGYRELADYYNDRLKEHGRGA